MTDPNRPRETTPVAEQLLGKPRHTAGLDSHRQPVRLGETDSDGHRRRLHQPPTDRPGSRCPKSIVAVQGGRLAEALQLAPTDPARDQQVQQVLEAVPDELLAAAARQAAGMLWLKQQR